MLAKTELYFVHGWGYDSTVWNDWLPVINTDITPFVFDRGYFKTNKQIFSFNISERFKILITHSFGLHYLSAADFAQIHMLVIISGFRQFHECSKNYKLSKRQIALMQEKLVAEPNKLLTDFYSNCGSTRPKTPAPLVNRQLLYDDLWILDNDQVDLDLLKPIRQIILLHGAKDQIVDIEHSKLINSQLPNSKLCIHQNAAHALPFTDRLWCINTIQKHLTKKIFANSET